MHVEHSWGDAPVMCHIAEQAAAFEVAAGRKMFDDDGLIKPVSTKEGQAGMKLRSASFHEISMAELGDAEAPARPDKKERKRVDNELGGVLPARRLFWTVEASLAKHITTAHKDAQREIADLDLEVRPHWAYGKGQIKMMKCSPDAFVQMAIQVAYFRDQNCFTHTYESSTTRIFLHGRTETIRSMTTESCAFARALGTDVSNEEKIALLKHACEKHHQYSRKAMGGQAIDRHFFGLYVVSVGKGIESPLLKTWRSAGWALSTSQVPQRQTSKGAWPNNDQGDVYYHPSGGFGPVADDGYGVSYAISGNKRLFFHISSKKSAPNTDSSRFADHIFDALTEIKALFPASDFVKRER